jgi:phosphoserine phosphatase
MLSEDEKQANITKLQEVKDRVHAIRQEMDALNKEKEDWFAKKSSYRDEVLKLIGNVKGLKEERNTLTTQVQLSKSERENIDKKIPELRAKMEQLKKEKESLMKKDGPRVNFFEARSEIEAMERKIETEPMSFEKEKKLMVMIKAKKKELKGANDIKEIDRKMHEIFEELDMYNKIRNISHSKVQAIAKNSQFKHLSMIEESQKIDELKAKEEEAFNKFKELKAKYKEKADELRIELAKQGEVGKALGMHNQEQREASHKEQRRTLADKRRDVEEKLKNKGKLTTEDLLVLQSFDDGSDDDSSDKQ